jgi:glycosyltransferase involved in cell wall biosynthesis
MRDYLVNHRASQTVTIFHPLGEDDGGLHEVTVFEHGELKSQKRRVLPSRPPFTYPLDLVIPLRSPSTDCWFGFNCLAAFRGLAERGTGRAGKVVYWGIDYVEDRFGKGQMTRAYEWLDGLCCRRSDAWFDLSEAALLARRARHGAKLLAPSKVVPMGAWLGRVPTTGPDGHTARRLIYMGHLVPRQGVSLLVDVIAILKSGGDSVTADVVGRGPELAALKAQASALGVADRIEFHGFVEDHRDVERILASGSIALAPYTDDPSSFSTFADPGKLKAYLAAGLPILMTGVPPNAKDLESLGAATVLPPLPERFAAETRRLLERPAAWARCRSASLEVARQYDWETILSGVLTDLGFDCT